MLLITMNSAVSSDGSSQLDFEQSIVNFDFNQDNVSDFERLNIEYSEQITDYSVLNNQLYQGQRFRIFNFSAYDGDNFKAALQSDQGLSSISISMGYGLEFLVNKRNKIGYEYLSSFPYNRGELIRFFWVSVF